MVYLLQDAGFPGTVHTLGIVGVVGQYEARLGHHTSLQLGQGKAEQTRDIGRLAISRTRHLCLAVIA